MVRFGLIGCGRIGQMHAQILMRDERANLGAVYDLSEQLASEISKKTGATFCRSDEELFDKLSMEPRLIKRPFLYKPKKCFLVGLKKKSGLKS